MAAEGIKLYGVSYDDAEALAAYVEGSGVEFTLLSDVDSVVIRQYEVLNTIVQPEDVPFYGVPFPGFFLLDEDGVALSVLPPRYDHYWERHLSTGRLGDFLVDGRYLRIAGVPATVQHWHPGPVTEEKTWRPAGGG